LAAYNVVIAPSPAAISDRDAGLLDRFVGDGGRLVVTGPDPAALDEFGNRRTGPVMVALGAHAQQSATPAAPPANRTALHTPQFLGKDYLTSTSPEASKTLGELFGTGERQLLQTDAAPSIHIEVRKLGDDTIVHLINPERLWDKQAPVQREIAISLAIPPGSVVTDVRLTSPEPLSRPAPAAVKLPFAVNGDRAAFKVALKAYAMVIVSSRPR
jgi:hypothetical protein